MQSISALKLAEMKQTNQDFLLVNTLPSKHFDSTKIEGAVNIPQDQSDFAQRVEEEASGKSQQVVVYCASSSCDSSEKAAKKLEDAGFTQVIDFTDGAKGWQELQTMSKR
ncbi:rhodanese-like domain-containing protein [Botrimarina mediterranea]|uniref:Molybdopterin biosynthesis protein MoeB n=1 Tax=Botrimarina mediterranea TaxID=2528022 RepID=A0A518K535_9BACT|nr:rhodanese-like domain-containing protein [Botrimarina mediterranea]QDV72910.1 molybdopterin biosynthesis protein MoeB [Botrimarina mediterranea]QDV77483.1 molybdopterin biosynthesis protein MoeB [Planctomycetes bacterium K2D]